MLSRHKRILIYVAHPDDDVLGAGATIARWIEEDAEVFIYLPATGINSRRNQQDHDTLDAHLKRLRCDAIAAWTILGVDPQRTVFGDYDDNEMDKYPLLQVIQDLEKVIEDVSPTLVITHHWRCTNIDHRVCYEAAVVATRPDNERRIELLSCEVPSSTGYLRPVMFEPNYYVRVEDRHVEAKIRAMEAFSTEAREDPHPRSPEALRALAKVRGSESGAMWAEAFQVVRCFG